MPEGNEPAPAAPGDTLAVSFLEEGGQTAAAVAAELAAFLAGARQSLDLAAYDVRLAPETAAPIQTALRGRLAAGVQVRTVFDAGDKPQNAAELDRQGASLAPRGTSERVADFGLPERSLRAIHGERALMHHKYIVRDGTDVWTGSLNFTDDAMTRMENLIVTLHSPAVAALYARDFAQLWRTGKVTASGAFPTEPATLHFAGAAATVDVDFSPGQGEHINAWLGKLVAGARRRVVICSMLLNSSRFLRGMLDVLHRGGVDVWGVYDRTQMDGVLNQWRDEAELVWKVEAVERIVREGKLIGKHSRPYRPDHSNNFMHNKTLVVDDTTVTGSYNFSHAAQENAENILRIESQAFAAEVVDYTRHLCERYGG